MKQLLRCSVVTLLCFATTTFGGKTVTMFQPTVETLSATPITDAGTGERIDEVFVVTRQTSACAMKTAPGTKRYDAWFEGNIDGGKLTFDTPNYEGGSSADIAWCTRGVLINSVIKLPPGRYRLTAKVTFKKVQY